MIDYGGRIQTVGGQILISEAAQQELGKLLYVSQRFKVEAKGVGRPLVLYDARGIGGNFNLFLRERDDEPTGSGKLQCGIALLKASIWGKWNLLAALTSCRAEWASFCQTVQFRL